MRDGLRKAVDRTKLQVAIDGPAGAGKSTVGRDLASALGCPYLDTGLMYRAVTLAALEESVPVDDGEALSSLTAGMDFCLQPDIQHPLLVNGVPTGDELRTSRVDASVSAVSAHPEVRRLLVERQREFAKGHAVVMVGRDIGTVVLPMAPVKLWITASPEERARRRAHQRGDAATSPLSEAVSDLRRRDALDSNREFSPLRVASDAVVVDTEQLNEREALAAALSAVARAVEMEHE